MLRAVACVCVIQVTVSIIVKDPPPVEPEYKYSYEIVDPTTGDTKSFHEAKQGDVVTGSYSVVDPDGVKRVVDYTADSKNGFQAIVRSEPITNRNILNDIPYSSLYQSHNYVIQPVPYTLKNSPMSVANVVTNVVANDIRYFSPGKELNMDESFDIGEYFKPNFRYE